MVVSRSAESQAVDDFLASLTDNPSALVLEGEAGIGKTTLWLAGLDRARERGFRVLIAHAAATESVLAYGALADLLGDIDSSAWAGLPHPQRHALNQIMLKDVAVDGAATDARAVAAAIVAIVNDLASEAPLLLAVDDLQWLDFSSTRIIGYASRRLSGQVGLLATARTDPLRESMISWLRLPRPDGLRRIPVPPLDPIGLHAVLAEHTGRSFSTTTLRRIHEISGGNPFFALELARTINGQQSTTNVELPSTLTEVIEARIGDLTDETRRLLLAAACVPAPTTELVAQAGGFDHGHAMPLLELAERQGIIAIDGHRIRFSHPLLARGVYTAEVPDRRRDMHRRLAAIVSEPEPRARHMALAATKSDPDTLRLLDEAAEIARLRGAPAAAAELLDLARGLGGDTAERRIASATQHFSAGDVGLARRLLEVTMKEAAPGAMRAQAAIWLALVRLLDDSFLEAARLLESVLDDADGIPALRAQMLITLSFALFNGDETAPALSRVQQAVTTAESASVPALLGQALSMRAMLGFLCGNGRDEKGMRLALDLDDPQAALPVVFRPRVHDALLLAWSGRLDGASDKMGSIRRRCIDNGEEAELAFIDLHSVIIESWRGNFVAARRIAKEAMERARQLYGDVPLSVAFTALALVDAYEGRVLEARENINESLAAGKRSGAHRMGEWPVALLGFLELSEGDHAGALSSLQPLLDKLGAATNGTEIIAAFFLPDAIEAMIQLGLLEDADWRIELLENNGRRLNRAWMSAVGGRCRGMLLAARGDVTAAIRAVEQALAEHDRVPMPFERARTQLLLGQLQHRRRHKGAAVTTLREAVSTFERLNTTLWAERARSELARAEAVGVSKTDVLTPSERRVAELAASGMTNREVAAAIFLSPKTVEFHLRHIYRKLDIHSRAQLGRRMGSRAE